MSRDTFIRKIRNADKRARAEIVFPGSTNEDRRLGNHHAKATIMVEATRRAEKPHVRLYGESFVHLECDEVIAMGALATITVSAEIEQDDPAGYFDQASNVEFARTATDSNPWPWCHVTVRAEWAGFEGVDMLGACSYRSEADFSYRSEADFMGWAKYYPDMVRAALESLLAEIKQAGGDEPPITEDHAK